MLSVRRMVWSVGSMLSLLVVAACSYFSSSEEKPRVEASSSEIAANCIIFMAADGEALRREDAEKARDYRDFSHSAATYAMYLEYSMMQKATPKSPISDEAIKDAIVLRGQRMVKRLQQSTPEDIEATRETCDAVRPAIEADMKRFATDFAANRHAVMGTTTHKEAR